MSKAPNTYTPAPPTFNVNPIIRHIVIGGGGTTGFMTLGALKFLQENGFWDISNIKSIYGTSIGSIAATSLASKRPLVGAL